MRWSDAQFLQPDALVVASAAGPVRLRLAADRAALYRDAAEAMLQEVRTAAEADRPCRLIVPVGPRGPYAEFVRLCLEQRLRLDHVRLFGMDEYLDAHGRWLPADHPLSLRGWLLEALAPLHRSGLKPEAVSFPDPQRPSAYSEALADAGGVDACFGGIGIHGHVAFNEPPDLRHGQPEPETLADAPTRVVALTPETVVMNSIRANGGDLANFPTHAVTVGLAEIRAARRLRLYADGGTWQRSVLRRALFSPPDVAWPVTLLAGHPDYTLTADPETAAPTHADAAAAGGPAR